MIDLFNRVSGYPGAAQMVHPSESPGLVWVEYRS